MRHAPRVLNKHKDDIPDGSVYVGRPSPWGNPYIIGKHGKREECVEQFEKIIDTFTLEPLQGKDLVCHCSPSPCHADVLLAYANRTVFWFKGYYNFLSNFYMLASPIEFEGDKYWSVENAYQAAKFPRQKRKPFTKRTCSPFQANKMGKGKRYSGDVITLMLDLLEQKFKNNSVLSYKLEKMEGFELINGTWWHDKFWGTCYCDDCIGYGMNNLGNLLMDIRNRSYE